MRRKLYIVCASWSGFRQWRRENEEAESKFEPVRIARSEHLWGMPGKCPFIIPDASDIPPLEELTRICRSFEYMHCYEAKFHTDFDTYEYGRRPGEIVAEILAAG